ncbi:MAG: type VI secretion system-associated protein TagF [Myxococcales bacterium]|nr:type VI secretion system-associated protein TagF [Myxococcales bacterium]
MAFWSRPKASPPFVTCYGKLPQTGDFIRLNATGVENVAFDRWLSASLNLARQTLGEAAFHEAYRPSVGLFIYRGDDGDGRAEPSRGLVGAWAASGDSAGRQYPMMVAASYDYEDMLAAGPALPLLLWPFLQRAYDLVLNGRGLAVDAFLGRVQELKPSAIESAEGARAGYHAFLHQSSAQAFWDCTFGTGAARYAVVQQVLESVAGFAGQERPQTGLALRFPIAAGDACAVSVWLDLTARIARWQRTVPTAFWCPQHEVLVHMGPPHVATFRELILPGEPEHVADLMRPLPMDEHQARHRIGPKLVAGLEQATTLASWLGGI